MNDDSRLSEWFVPKFGPIKFRIICGMLFLPYTGMCVSFVVWGVLFSGSFNFEQLTVIIGVYFVSLGVSAHVADSIGSKKLKPWNSIFSPKQAWIVIIFSLGFSYMLGIFLAVKYAPYLIVMGIVEGFFLFAYNFELFDGRFHNNFWFSVSWGVLPFLAGYVLCKNSITLESLLLSGIPFGLSYLEIILSRNYKNLKRCTTYGKKTDYYEICLKVLSLGVIAITIILSVWILKA
jgi:hypothetical protein